MIIVLGTVALVYFSIGIVLLKNEKEKSECGPYSIPMSIGERFFFFFLWLPLLLYELFFL